MPSTRKKPPRKKYRVNVTPMAENHLDRVTDFWLYAMQNPKIAQQIHIDFWDKVPLLQDRPKAHRLPWDTYPELAELDYHLFKFSPRYHVAMLYRVDDETGVVHVQFVCDLREHEILCEMIDAAQKIKPFKF